MDFPLLLTMSLLLGPLVGCAGLGERPTEGSPANVVSVACTNNLSDLSELSGVLDWELTVKPPVQIEGGRPFSATLGGVAVFSESILNAVQVRVPGGVDEVNLVDIKATVQVRSGATGDDVTLGSSIPWECFGDATACDPKNDVLPGVPGFRGNTDCKPENESNPCGRFLLLPRSDDCSPDGECAALGRIGPGSSCSYQGFCITGDLRFELEGDFGEYTADPQGDVLFGWAEESTGATVQEDGTTWDLPAAVYEDPVGPVGLRVVLGPVRVALECAMGVEGPDGAPSPTPNSELIAFPIQPR